MLALRYGQIGCRTASCQRVDVGLGDLVDRDDRRAAVPGRGAAQRAGEPAKSLVAKMASRSAPFGTYSEPSAFSTATFSSAANRMFVAS